MSVALKAVNAMYKDFYEEFRQHFEASIGDNDYTLTSLSDKIEHRGDALVEVGVAFDTVFNQLWSSYESLSDQRNILKATGDGLDNIAGQFGFARIADK